MSEQEQTENADSSTAQIEEAASSAEIQVEVPEVPEVPETEDLQLKRKTAERFESLDGIIKSQQATIDQMQRSQGVNLDYQDPGAPKLEDFEDDIEYARAAGAYDATKNVVDMLSRNQVNHDQAQRNFVTNQNIQAHTGRVQAFQAEHTDFQQVITGSMLNVQDQGGNLTVAVQTILEQPNSAAIEYHLASNPELSMALNRSTPAQAGAIIARLSDQLTVSPANINSAPPPISSENTGTGTAAASDDFRHIGKATFE